jgi:hypothetical protein
MWQRIQTLFLISVIVCLAASIFLPIWAAQETEMKSHVLYALHYSVLEKGENGTNQIAQYMPYSLTGLLLVAAITIAVIQIGKYSNRMLQLKLGALNALFIAGGLASAIYFAYQLQGNYPGTFGFGLYLPFGAAISNFVANQFIRRDERIVRDSNRLR